MWRSARAPRFCSVNCHNANQAEQGKRKRVTKTCKYCGKTFSVGSTIAHRYPGNKCSHACGIDHHLWINCAHCGRQFNARHNQTRRFCSKRCYLSSWSESRIEVRVRERLEAYQFEFESQYPVKGAHHFDFYVKSLNLLIEADGTYWHSRPWSKERDARKTAKARALGYAVERFPESIIMSEEWPATFDAVMATYV